MDAEEVVQDALWTATRKIDGFMGRSALGTWLYRITMTAAYQRLRRRRHAGREVSWDDCAASLDGPARPGGGPAWSGAPGEPTGRAELRACTCGSAWPRWGSASGGSQARRARAPPLV